MAGTYWCNGGLYANYTSINNSSNYLGTRAFVSGQGSDYKSRLHLEDLYGPICD